ncbi:MAG TPA: tetratricopeptide repeat protein [Pirellulales bacterium]|jgi:hypothetical protein|nr:tetratricopeptide repeat protein [Pirellulales bacterium]
MKTERRHELQTNVLADSLARWGEKARPYSRAALAGLIAIVAVLFAWSYYSAQASRHEANGWNEYFEAMNERDPRERLGQIVERYPGTSVGQISRVVLADIELDDGTNRLFSDKAAAKDELRRVIDAYQAVLFESDEPSLRQRAMYGLARAREGLGQELTKAREEYQSLAERWPDSPYAAPALERAKDLERAETKQFYDWFAKYEPPRPMSNEPGTPGARPDFLKDSLEPGGLKLPSILDESKSGTSAAPAAETAADESPAEGAAATDAKPTEQGGEEAKEATTPPGGASENPAKPPSESPAPPTK